MADGDVRAMAGEQQASNNSNQKGGKVEKWGIPREFLELACRREERSGHSYLRHQPTQSGKETSRQDK